MEYLKKCGCKGIRTCLICEKDGQLSKLCDEIKETVQYQYCPHCDLCWPVNSVGSPLYLGRLTLVDDFVTAEEESELVANIDQLEWMPSQSGRKKQDFGPKVNFKKKKSKIGNFKGFPRFTENLVKRLGRCGDLNDFRPVELCHLDYDPDRGSAIEPHMDDTWIWGERLVTLNLVSSTVLTFTPADAGAACGCPTQSLKKRAGVVNGNKRCNHIMTLDPVFLTCDSSRLEQNKLEEPLECQTKNLGTTELCYTNGAMDENKLEEPLECQTKDLGTTELSYTNSAMEQNKLEEPLKCQTECLGTHELSYTNGIRHSSKNVPSDCLFRHQSPNLLDSCPAEDVYQVGQSNSEMRLNCQNKCLTTCMPNTVNELKLCSHSFPVSCLHEEDYLNLKDLDGDIGPKSPQTTGDNQTQCPKSHDIRDLNVNICQKNPKTICEPQTKCVGTNGSSIKDNNHEMPLSFSQEKLFNGSDAVEDMCTAYRTGQNKQVVEVLVPLPPRSLVVVAGCSRRNWFHEIKRKDIDSRRLAMTFRELSSSFMAGGPDEAVGSQLLELGRTFWEVRT